MKEDKGVYESLDRGPSSLFREAYLFGLHDHSLLGTDHGPGYIATNHYHIFVESLSLLLNSLISNNGVLYQIVSRVNIMKLSVCVPLNSKLDVQ
jgi:hypothetical protein